MDEFTSELRARAFVKKAAPTAVPVSLGPYLSEVHAKLRVDLELPPQEAGYTMSPAGRHRIVVNGNDHVVRQRFTVCHEIAHLALDLPTEHEVVTSGFARRSANELACDVFAAELLLPIGLFRPLTVNRDPSFEVIESLANSFEASLSATASRFVTLSAWACALVVAEQGRVRYVVRSPSLRGLNAWVVIGSPLPPNSRAYQVRQSARTSGRTEVDADVWFENLAGTELSEDVRHFAARDRTLTLLWLSEDEMLDARRTVEHERAEPDLGLKELDGILPWPRK
jgi:hypothetical protein